MKCETSFRHTRFWRSFRLETWFSRESQTFFSM